MVALTSLFAGALNVSAQTTGDYIIDEVVDWPIQEKVESSTVESEFDESQLVIDETNILSLDLSENQLTQINIAIDTYQSAFDQLGLFVQISDNIIHFEVNQEDAATFQMPAASVIKLFILVDYYHQVAEGTLDPNDMYTLNEADIVGGSGALQGLPIGSEHSYQTLAELMIQVSDNTATNVIIDKLGGLEQVSENIQSYGFLQTELNRYMMDQYAIDAGDDNLTSAIDVANLLLAAVNGYINGPQLDAEMLEVLSQHGPVKQARDLSNERSYYGKTGEYPAEGVENDALLYFIETDEGDIPVILISLTQGDNSEAQINAMADFGVEIERIITEEE